MTEFIYDLRFTVYDLRFTNYDLRFTNYGLRFTIDGFWLSTACPTVQMDLS